MTTNIQWKCNKCGGVGGFSHGSDMSLQYIIDTIHEAHSKMYPMGCKWDTSKIIINPEKSVWDW